MRVSLGTMYAYGVILVIRRTRPSGLPTTSTTDIYGTHHAYLTLSHTPSLVPSVFAPPSTKQFASKVASPLVVNKLSKGRKLIDPTMILQDIAYWEWPQRREYVGLGKKPYASYSCDEAEAQLKSESFDVS